MADKFKTKTRGQNAERDACTYLEKRGLVLLEKNYFSPCGEIDLIMRDGEEIVFVEVRQRRQMELGSALETVSKPKQKRLIRTALLYLQKKRWLDQVPCRFDVLAFDADETEWLQNAFGFGFV